MKSSTASRPIAALTGVLLMTTIAGCADRGAVIDARLQQGARSTQQLDAEQLDALTNAYADRFMTLIKGAADAIKQANPSSEERRMAHLFKTAAAASIYDIASNPDPFTQLVDMLLVVTLLSQVWIDEARADDVFGERADLLVHPLRRSREDIWAIASRTMRPEQLEALDLIIWEWRRRNLDVQFVSFVRFDDFADARSRAIVRDVRRGGGLLAPIDEARLEVERARRLGERAFFFAKRAGFLTAWEAEALVLDLLTDPSIQQIIDNSTSLSQSIDIASSTFAELPDRLAAERVALVEALDARQMAFDETLQEVRLTSGDGERLASAMTETATAAEQMLAQLERTSGALSETVAAVDQLAGRFDMGNGPATDGASFDPESYVVALATLGETARELNTLVASSITLMESDAWALRLHEVAMRGDTLADRLLNRALLLLGAFFLMLLGYRILVLLLQRRFSSATTKAST